MVEWRKLEKRRDTSTPCKALDDLDSMLNTNIYRNPEDPVNWGHETLHGIHSRIRETVIQKTSANFPTPTLRPYPNLHSGNRVLWVKSWGSINGFYVFGGWYCTLNEPSFTLSHVAGLIPTNLRKMSYDLYLVEQQRYWDDSPLYVFDEAVAYQGGTIVGMQLQDPQRTADSFQRALEMNAYAILLARETDDQAIKGFATFLTGRNTSIYDRGAMDGWLDDLCRKNFEDLPPYHYATYISSPQTWDYPV